MKRGVRSAAFRPYPVPRKRAEARTPNILMMVGVRFFPRFIRLKCYQPPNPNCPIIRSKTDEQPIDNNGKPPG